MILKHGLSWIFLSFALVTPNSHQITDHVFRNILHTKVMDPLLCGNTMEQNHDSKTWILMDPQGFCIDHAKLTIKQHTMSIGTDYTTTMTEPLLCFCNTGRTQSSGCLFFVVRSAAKDMICDLMMSFASPNAKTLRIHEAPCIGAIQLQGIGKTAERMFCDIKTFERKLQVFERDLESGQLKYFPNLKMHLENSTFADNPTSHQEIYKEFSSIVAAAKVNFSNRFLQFRKMETTLFSYFSR